MLARMEYELSEFVWERNHL